MYVDFADNQNLNLGNKVANVLPFLNLFKFSIVKFGAFNVDLSIDESMVTCFRKACSTNLHQRKANSFRIRNLNILWKHWLPLPFANLPR